MRWTRTYCLSSLYCISLFFFFFFCPSTSTRVYPASDTCRLWAVLVCHVPCGSSLYVSTAWPTMCWYQSMNCSTSRILADSMGNSTCTCSHPSTAPCTHMRSTEGPKAPPTKMGYLQDISKMCMFVTITGIVEMLERPAKTRNGEPSA